MLNSCVCLCWKMHILTGYPIAFFLLHIIGVLTLFLPEPAACFSLAAEKCMYFVKPFQHLPLVCNRQTYYADNTVTFLKGLPSPSCNEFPACYSAVNSTSKNSIRCILCQGKLHLTFETARRSWWKECPMKVVQYILQVVDRMEMEWRPSSHKHGLCK